ncbi:MAG: efflux RND transporter permease subunit, partial [Roseimicrobium sp.]
ANHLNVGGKTVEENGMEFIVRGTGLLRSAEDIEQIVLKDKVLLKDIARVEVGGDYRSAVLDVGGSEVVGGIVVMRNGENARAVIDAVKAKIAQLQPALPAGVVITPFYDRSTLIDRCLHTLKQSLFEEILLVILAHVLFLWHFRSILIVTLPLPISLLVSFIAMKECGLTANLMSLCGLAIAIGVLVDGAIVMTENVIRRCSEVEKPDLSTILAAAQQVGRPVFFSMAIILLAFVPVFALTGQEGRLFHPLAFAKTFAMLAAAVLSVTLVPALCATLMRGPFPAEDRNRLMRLLLRLYDPALDFALKHARLVMVLAAGVLATSLLLVRNVGIQFMPPLHEGSLLFMPTFVPGTALSEVKRVMAWQDQVFASFPEVQLAVGKLGRADTATDPAPVEMVETTITLKPQHEWRAGMTLDKLIAEMTAQLQQVPGSIPGFLQPIEGRVLMLATGIRAQLGIKLLGDDLHALQKWAGEIEKLVRQIPGATGVATSSVLGRPYLQIEPNRVALAQRGLRVDEVLDVIQTGLGGKEAGVVLEGRARVPIQVRLQRGERDDIERVRDLRVNNVPLGQLATIQRVAGPNEITSEDGQLRVAVQTNIAGRDPGSFVQEVQGRISTDIVPRLPQGITIAYSGDYEHQEHARRTLLFIVPCVLLIIFLLLHHIYRSVAEAAHVLLAVPFALSGGFLLQWAMQIPFSVAVWIGYIALFGTAIQTAIVMVAYLDESVARGGELLQAIKDGARLRLRPKVMTVATIVASLLPMLWSTQTGAEIIKPIAVPVIGGMVSSLVHILIITPVLFAWLRRSNLLRNEHDAEEAA